MSTELEEQADLAVRLRVALSLCPADALTHRRSDRVSRLEKIERHLANEDLVPAEFVSRLAEAIDRTLDAWQVERVNVTSHREKLLERDGGRCQACRVSFDEDPCDAPSVKLRDPFKLVWIDPGRRLFPTVDHREPVSRFGTNELENLWLLCRFCNEGKGDGSPMLLKHELDFATLLPWTSLDAPGNSLVVHSGRLVYRVLARHQFMCGHCGSRDAELVIRKERERGLAVLSNLTSVCADCVATP